MSECQSDLGDQKSTEIELSEDAWLYIKHLAREKNLPEKLLVELVLAEIEQLTPEKVQRLIEAAQERA